jgi:hypothetical protein
VEVPELLGHCVELELRAQLVYETLAQRFADQDPVRRFFQTLAGQEQSHGELLELCRETAGRDGWLEGQFEPWRDAVPRLERQMDDAEASLEGLDEVTDALRLVIRVESSEINDVFGGVVAATDSDFVRNLRAFQTAGATHISYISDQISKFEPDLAPECGSMRIGRSG